MSGICEIFPDDESCKVPEPEDPVIDDTPVDDDVEDEGGDDMVDEEVEDDGADMEAEEGKEGKGGLPEDMSGWDLTAKFLYLSEISHLHTFEAQLKFLQAAIMASGIAALNKFRYKSKSTYFDNAKTGTNTNYNKLSDDIYQYGVLGVMGLAAVTQLASMLGIAVPVNMMVWEIGVGQILPMLSLASLVMSGLAWEQGYDSTDANAATTQAFAQAGIRSNFSTVASILFKVLHYYKPWKAAQWIALGEDAQTEALIALEEKVIAIAEKKMAAKAAEKMEGDEEEEGDEEGEEDAEGEEGEGEEEEGEADEEEADEEEE